MAARKRQAVLEDLRAKIAELPLAPGVYLFKDDHGVVLYVGKAKNLRSRVASYFQPSADLLASRGPTIQRMVEDLVCDVDVLTCDSEVDALLHENRLIKDIQPRFNDRLKDDKSFPYLQITTGEDFPRVEITRMPLQQGAKLYGPFVSPTDLRSALPLLQRVFQFRTCKLDIADDDDSRRHYRPCILHNIKQCSAPCAAMISKDAYAGQIRHFRQFLESKASLVRKELTGRMKQAAERMDYELAAALRDQLKALEGLQKRGLVSEHVQPEVFYVDPAEGLARLGELLKAPMPIRTIEGIDIAHLGGQETCGSMVCFIDGKPFKSGYRRYKIKTVSGGDDFAAMREVVWRRYKYAGMNEELFPDVILIDGGKGQLSAACGAFDELAFRPPRLISLAKREEEVFIHGHDQPLRLPRRDPALRLLQSVRDEAHRFAQNYHHVLRRRSTLGRNEPVRGRTRRSQE
ncbi:MAG: UvrABC system protein C [Planctomycetes bacterium ADurb.Bin126]|nr:MAG: UvrABC system protein C [Planctomycetes bacterium ADurb.Bin126]HOD80350.1 excinuclease ABC subunit UvrC [Phycisphaerae bacterium]HQL75705.1 excinuclease ABC subunit UvrC [Phycisphaerae bacterium]